MTRSRTAVFKVGRLSGFETAAAMRRIGANYSLSTLLGWFSFLAIACGVVMTGSPGWGTAFLLCFLLSLGWAIVMSISEAGSKRCFWSAYLVFAVLYFAATRNKLDWLGIDYQEIPANNFVEVCMERLHPRVETSGGWEFPQEGKVAAQASHRTIAIVLGCIAGTLAKFTHNRRTTDAEP